MEPLITPSTTPPPTVVFVFGSNLAGRHGKGAALHAQQKWGAVPGKGEGLQGRSYAIPTKDQTLKVRSLYDIATSVVTFITFAADHPEMYFIVTRVGCGLAGYKDFQIAPLFTNAPSNCLLPNGWREGVYPQDRHSGKDAQVPEREKRQASLQELMTSLEEVVVG